MEMPQCQGKGCAVELSSTAAEESLQWMAAQIPVWIVKRQERRPKYARRVFGPRCEACRAKLIRELRA
jgi:hypothetical protein